MPVSENRFFVEINSNRDQNKEGEYELSIFNLIGQIVFNKKYLFDNGKEEIILPEHLSSGEYIISLKEKTNEYRVNKKIILIK
ncbi:MAG: T9SS type A sorting domain-containing protein [Bacteroidota bacterium]